MVEFYDIYVAGWTSCPYFQRAAELARRLLSNPACISPDAGLRRVRVDEYRDRHEFKADLRRQTSPYVRLVRVSEKGASEARIGFTELERWACEQPCFRSDRSCRKGDGRSRRRRRSVSRAGYP